MNPLEKNTEALQHPLLNQIEAQLSKIIVGKQEEIRLALVCLLSGGHLLLEDLPGVGKTTLAHALAKTLGFDYQRVQFTNDMLPADILGVSIYNKKEDSFVFHKGPIFTNLVLADEINRATPKSQSALLEAMEEQQITIDGQTMPLPKPFLVIGTQNPLTQAGTFPLPESQLDRFLMKISLGYPSEDAERSLLTGENRRDMLKTLQPVVNATQFIELQQKINLIHVSEPALDYLQSLLTKTRTPQKFQHGLSPRAGIGLLHAAKAWALLHGRDYLLPDDIQAIFPAVARHRLVSGQPGQISEDSEIQELLESVPLHNI